MATLIPIFWLLRPKHISFIIMEKERESELLSSVEVLTPEALTERKRIKRRLERQVLLLEQCMEKLEAEFTDTFPVNVYFDRSSRTLSDKQVDEVLAALARRGWRAEYRPGLWAHLSISPA